MRVGARVGAAVGVFVGDVVVAIPQSPESTPSESRASMSKLFRAHRYSSEGADATIDSSVEL
jgi:hypothetical protein